MTSMQLSLILNLLLLLLLFIYLFLAWLGFPITSQTPPFPFNP